MIRALIGIGLPYFGVLGMLPWIATQDRYVAGVPLVYGWMFMWFVLTSVVLFICWRCFDRPSRDVHPHDA